MKLASVRLVWSTLLVAFALGLTRAAAATPSADWSEAMAAFAREDAARPSPTGAVLFVGSSSIRMWSTLAADFPGTPVVNRGFGGSHIADSVCHFDRLVAPHQPRLVVFYAGTNDIAAGKTPEAVAADFRAFCDLLHAARPAARIIYISIQLSPARWQFREKFALANTYIAAFCAADPRRRFLDTNAAMLTPEGQAPLEFFQADQLHLSPAGYAVWRRLLAPLLQGDALWSHRAPKGPDDSRQHFSLHRWPITDPVRLGQDLKVAIQDPGWQSGEREMKLRDDLASVAFWRQAEPRRKFPARPDRGELELHPAGPIISTL